MKSRKTRIGLFRPIFGMLFLYACLMIPVDSSSDTGGWKASAASVVITPGSPVLLGGYSSRRTPFEGVIHDLYVKALALEDPEGHRAVIVTSDLIGVERKLSDRIAERVEKDFGIPRRALLINSSHTHCGPEIRFTKLPFYEVTDELKAGVPAYTERLEEKFVEAIRGALDDMKPAVLSFSSAKPVPFAVSRRFPTPEGIVYRSGPSSYYTGGPRDDVVPVLKVAGPDGTVRVILFGYACHPITLSRNMVCGDYPGFAQRYVEEAFPGATAMFMQGACGQLVPNARYQIEYAMGHGRALAAAVVKALEGEEVPIDGNLDCAFEDVVLDFQPAPERKVLEGQLHSGNTGERQKAALLLKMMDAGEPIPTSNPFPFQVIRFGRRLLLIGLCGEPVVEYAVKFKSEFLTYGFVWVAGYCNDEFGYLPTWKVLVEGGYEGSGALVRTPFPGPFTETVEKRVSDGVRMLVDRVSAGLSR